MTAADKTRLLAERVMGWKQGRNIWAGHWFNADGGVLEDAADWDPLTNLSHAGEVLEAMVRKGFEFDAQDCGVGKYKAWFRWGGVRVSAIALLLATAICHAALLANGVKEEEL